MFQEWGFLISEMVLLIILAALLGLLVGWIVWGRRRGGTSDVQTLDKLTADLASCNRARDALEADLAAANARHADAEAAAATAAMAAETAAASAVAAKKPAPAKPAAKTAAKTTTKTPAKTPAKPAATKAAKKAAPKTAAPKADAPGDTTAKDYDGDGVVEGANEGTKPKTLTAARGGKPDDLKEIKGVGPKLETLCNRLGFYHFDQIAAWSADEVAWVDANLTGFKGRVSRDDWVAQAKVLAEGGSTAFSKKVKKGGVY